MAQIHLFSGLGSSLLPSLRRGTRTIESLIDKITDADHHIWNDWRKVAASITAGKGPVVLIGHSNGLIACAEIAKVLRSRGIDVRYIGAIDPTAGRFPAFGSNVLRVDEFWASSGFPALARRIPLFGQGKCLFDPGFRGAHRLYHMRGSHIGLASDEHVHATILAGVKEALK